MNGWQQKVESQVDEKLWRGEGLGLVEVWTSDPMAGSMVPTGTMPRQPVSISRGSEVCDQKVVLGFVHLDGQVPLRRWRGDFVGGLGVRRCPWFEVEVAVAGADEVWNMIVECSEPPRDLGLMWRDPILEVLVFCSEGNKGSK